MAQQPTPASPGGSGVDILAQSRNSSGEGLPHLLSVANNGPWGGSQDPWLLLQPHDSFTWRALQRAPSSPVHAEMLRLDVLGSLPALHPSLPVWRLWEGGTPFLFCGSTEGLGMEVLSDGVLNEQLGLLWTAGMSQGGWEGGRHFQDGGISRCNSSFTSCVGEKTAVTSPCCTGSRAGRLFCAGTSDPRSWVCRSGKLDRHLPCPV